MKSLLKNQLNKRYNTFLMFGTGAVGDFVMMIDLAKRANNSDKNIKTYIFVKENEDFLGGLLKNYDFIKVYRFNIFSFLYLIYLTIFKKSCLIWETANFNYSKRVFILFKFIRYFSKSNIVAMQTEDKEFKDILDEKHIININNSKYLYEYGIELLKILELDVSYNIPELSLPQNIDISKYNILKNNYILIAPTTSKFRSIRRTLPAYRWANIINNILNNNQGKTLKVVLIGSPNEKLELENIWDIVDINNKYKVQIISKNIKAEEVCSLIYNSKIFIGLRSGIGAIASVMKMQGKYILLNSRSSEKMWNYDFNKNIKVFQNINECKCRGTWFDDCYIKDNKDNGLYHRCIYYINDYDIIDYINNL